MKVLVSPYLLQHLLFGMSVMLAVCVCDAASHCDSDCFPMTVMPKHVYMVLVTWVSPEKYLFKTVPIF